jgi:hypothetical protein
MLLSLFGCDGNLFHAQSSKDALQAFQVSKVRLQPSFTKISGTQGQAESGVIETFVELSDQFGDPIKALGTCRFEIYQYRPISSDPRGPRCEIDGIQTVDLRDLQVNQKHWDNITRSYRFKIKLPPMSSGADKIVLQATFIMKPEYRLQDMLVVSRKP